MIAVAFLDGDSSEFIVVDQAGERWVYRLILPPEIGEQR